MAGVKGNQEYVFGLDIGTRSIVGTVGYRDGSRFHVVAQRSKEHETRSMLDRQIHDIGKVGKTIREVKEKLEQDLEMKLSGVCIAAAGRVLRTVTTFLEYEYNDEKEVADEDIYALETMGVEKAYEEFNKSNDTDMQFYCVGYTAMRYYLNGYVIGNLEGHKAKTVGVDLIATFLPDDVVDGLYKAVEIAGLSVVNLTLEPIAAIQVAIPEKFRMLNLALVDVGAGTSDISITKDGTITAYGMIPMAGDSLTDVIVQHCLVDFETAETIKRQAGQLTEISYSDILGLPQTITAQQVLEVLHDTIDTMTQKAADCITELNGDKPVSAVFVVGGGGVIPGYTDSLAEKLGIVKERVAIRGGEVMQSISFDMENARTDSLMVTPIGICLSYYEQSNNFIFIHFNEYRVKLYDNGRLAVVDAAIAAGFPNDSLFPKRGEGVVYTVNGKSRMVRGHQGETAVITVNGQEADIHTRIANGDRVIVEPSTAGDRVIVELSTLPELNENVTVKLNGGDIVMPKIALVNGEIQMGTYQIQEGDVIEVPNWYTASQIAEFADIPVDENTRILVNDIPAKADTRVYDTFSVTFVQREPGEVDPWAEEETFEEQEKETWESLPEEDAPVEDIREAGDSAPGVSESVEGDGAVNTAETRSGAGSPGQTAENESKTPQEMPKVIHNVTLMVNGEPVTLRGKVSYVFVDVFDYIDFDLREPAGSRIMTQLNGRSAEYMEEIKDGDVIDIFWAK